MTQVTVSLPDDLARRAADAGLLSDRAIRNLLENAMRQQAGRRLLALSDELAAANIAPMSEDEVVVLVKTVRAERRNAQAARADRS